ncbi:wall-associated receptor kinase-like 14 [Ananas comosus]|uniref:Wall-associated receptor kinase-like 14 n=1 Tax=Ananas comosus TaxID=4615 RepID=A0A6P5FF99_ANACO|nr:wall-associated receptor kinase-like 14 [Ananas comosus]
MLLGILLCIAFSHLILPRAGAAAAAAANCRRTCGSSTVPYPFGFSAGCGIRLTCNSTNSILVAETYPVWNITPDSLLLDVAPSCDRPVRAAIGVLFGPNYAMTWRNGLFLRNCTATAAASRCLLPTSLATQISQRKDLASCGEKGDNITCYSSGRTDGFLSPGNATASGCGYVFTSVLYSPGGGDEGAQMPAIVFGAAELGWWLNGPCRCSANATCAPVAVPGNATGFRCSCDAGFVGDGFADGDGCVRAAGRCGASNRKKFGDCGGRAKVGLLIGGIVAGASLLLGLLLLLCSAARRRKWAASSEQTKHLLRLSEAASCPVPVYSYKDMERATNAFSDAYKLGTGAYATVYVGKLPEGLVAVKRIRCGDPSSRSSSAMNEIRLISCVRHPNLVRLLGCCVDRGEQILVYEFVPNGTLAQHLRRGGGVGGGLPWRARLGIAAEAARAVAYLHTALQPPIYHRDIKSTNILLDRELRPKIADFGLSRAGVAAESSHVSTAPQGTPGYLDPQYHQDFHLTDKSDVYSFGVVLVEMLTALKVVDFERPPTEVNLPPPPADADAADEGEGEGEWVMDSVRRVAELAFRCLAFHKDVRPCMTEVAEELERIRLSAPPPPPPPAPASEEEEEEEDVVEVLGSGSEAVEKLEGKRRRRRRRSRGVRLEEKARVDSPVSVQEVLWVSEHSSSPSTNGSMPRFVL